MFDVGVRLRQTWIDLLEGSIATGVPRARRLLAREATMERVEEGKDPGSGEGDGLEEDSGDVFREWDSSTENNDDDQSAHDPEDLLGSGSCGEGGGASGAGASSGGRDERLGDTGSGKGKPSEGGGEKHGGSSAERSARNKRQGKLECPICLLQDDDKYVKTPCCNSIAQ